MNAGRPPRPAVLLVEDSATDARLAAATLECELGCQVSWVTTLRAGLERLHADRYACVLADLGLPDADGLEVVAALVDAAPEAGVVVLTGREDETVATESIRRGADDYLLKSEIGSRHLGRIVSFAIERRHARAEAARLAARYEAVMKALGDGIVVLGPDGRVVDANPAARRLLGDCGPTEAGACLPSQWHILTATGAAVPPAGSPWEQAQAGVPAVMHSVRLLGPSGESPHVDVAAFPLRAREGGPVTGSVITIRDVTHRHVARDADRFRAALLEALGQAVVVTDDHDAIVFWNSAAESMFGWAPPTWWAVPCRPSYARPVPMRPPAPSRGRLRSAGATARPAPSASRRHRCTTRPGRSGRESGCSWT